MSRILVVDDEEDVLELTTSLLSAHEVVTATSWSNAFSVLTSTEFDLVLLDVQLQGLPGNEIAKILTAALGNFEDRKIPTIALFSAMDKGALKALAKECGVQGFVPKDFANSAGMIRKIERLLK
jgi:CheY-like chemotaxis protein